MRNYITPTKQWNMRKLENILPIHVINKIKAILIPFSDINDKMAWGFSQDGNYSFEASYGK